MSVRYRTAGAVLVLGLMAIPLATVPPSEGVAAAERAPRVGPTSREDARWSLNRQAQMVVWPPSAQVDLAELKRLRVFVAVLNNRGRAIGVQSRLRPGIGIYIEGRRKGGPPLSPRIPTYRVVLKQGDFMWLPPGHLYGIRISPLEAFPQLARPGDYSLSFQYSNPFRVDMGQGRLPFLGYTDYGVVHLKVLAR